MNVIGLTMLYDEKANADRWFMTVSRGITKYNVEIPKEVHDSLVKIGLRKEVAE